MKWVSKGRVAPETMQSVYLCMCFVTVTQVITRLFMDNGKLIWKRWIFLISIGYNNVLTSRELMCWLCANLYLYLIIKANSGRLNCPKLPFSKCELCFVFTWRILSWNNFFQSQEQCSELVWVETLFFWKSDWLCHVCDLCLKKRKDIPLASVPESGMVFSSSFLNLFVLY